MPQDNQFVTAIDVPIEQEILYDYDDMYGVVDDKINPPDNEKYTPTLSIIEILGGKCTICPENHEKLLTIRNIHDYEDEQSSKYLKQLIEETIGRGEDPRKNFRVLCYNCDIRMKKMKKFLKSAGLTELSQEKLEQGLRIMYS